MTYFTTIHTCFRMEVAVGAYEELVLGYKLVNSDGVFSLEPSFNDHSHLGCVKCMSISENGILASGSSDEVIQLFNLRTRRDLGNLLHHSGSITGIQFFGKKFMFTTSEDNTIGVWHVGRWECLRTLRGHKDHVYSLAVHPSGKMALSISKDKTLRTWNLMTGKCAYTTALKTVAELALWTPGGDKYIVISNNVIDVYKVETGKISQTITCDKRIAAAVFLNESVLAVSGEGGTIHLFNITENTHILEVETETTRVRGMALCENSEFDARWLVTASSDGFIKVYGIHQTKDKWELTCETSLNTKFRLTCVAAAPVAAKKEVKEEQTSDEEETEDLDVPVEQDEKVKPRVTVQIDSDQDEDENDDDNEDEAGDGAVRKGASDNGMGKSLKKRNRKRKPQDVKQKSEEEMPKKKKNKGADPGRKKKIKLF